MENSTLTSFFYESVNHLGNVLVTFSDKRISVCDEELDIAYFKADVLSAVDYYPFHSIIPDRQWYAGNDSSAYRFGGSNGQEKDDEIYGVGNSYSAEYWQYDPRLGRRWNTDPMSFAAPGWTPYRILFNSPLVYGDKLGLFETRYENEEGELIHETDDGINVTVTVPNHKLEDVTKELKPWIYENNHADDQNAYRYTNTSFWNSMLTESILNEGGSYKAFNSSGDYEHFGHAQSGGGAEGNIYNEIAGAIVGGMELSYRNDAKQVLRYGQRIDGKVRSAETLTRANRISSNATANYLGYAGKALGIYGAYDAGMELFNDPSNPANWIKASVSTGMLFLKANPLTFGIGVGYTILDEGGYIDDWFGN